MIMEVQAINPSSRSMDDYTPYEKRPRPQSSERKIPNRQSHSREYDPPGKGAMMQRVRDLASGVPVRELAVDIPNDKFVLNIMCQEDELDGLEEKAISTGASKVYIEDLREEFITDYIYPTLKAGAIYEGKYLLGTSFWAPINSKTSG